MATPPPPEPPCRLCKSRCASNLATGTLFGIYFQPSFLPAAVTKHMKLVTTILFLVLLALMHCVYIIVYTRIVPCNVRLEFNKLTGDTVTFEAPGGPYNMEVKKGRNMSQIGGYGWNRFISHMGITGGELISFSFRAERPKLAVIYLNTDEDDEDPLDEVIYTQK